MKKILIGKQDFKELIVGNYYYVDKTLFVKDVIDDTSGAILITRPRRFGKTLNMSMLDYFFNIDKKDSKELFKGLKIMEEGEEYTSKLGYYPCIFVTFADVKADSYEAMLMAVKTAIHEVYDQYRYLIESENLEEDEKEYIKDILNFKIDDLRMWSAIRDLSKFLYKHYGKKAIILIDEYDVPLQSAYVSDYYERAVSYIKQIYIATVKNNNYFEKAVFTRSIKNSQRKYI